MQQELEKKEDKDSKVNGKIEEIKSIVNSFTSPVAPNKVSKENITEKSPNAKTIVDETKDASTVKNQNNTTESSTDVISNTDYNDIDNSTTAETPFTELEKTLYQNHSIQQQHQKLVPLIVMMMLLN